MEPLEGGGIAELGGLVGIGCGEEEETGIGGRGTGCSGEGKVGEGGWIEGGVEDGYSEGVVGVVVVGRERPVVVWGVYELDRAGETGEDGRRGRRECCWYS